MEQKCVNGTEKLWMVLRCVEDTKMCERCRDLMEGTETMLMDQRYDGSYREVVDGRERWWNVQRSCGIEMWWKELRCCGTEMW
jgi:hypothetical protein